ncbi:S8 family peptidase [Chryseobacterium sp. Mn2064]|uniref:S8 family peptidase n=1 Tax=Chryseobacterium sp. Mn2064 TaxID=3395263 RepID=UPI003BE60EAB
MKNCNQHQRIEERTKSIIKRNDEIPLQTEKLEILAEKGYNFTKLLFMKAIDKIMLILFMMITGIVYGQVESKYFYYYKDKKYYLQLDKSTIAISAGNDNIDKIFESKNKPMELNSRKTVKTIDNLALKNRDNKAFYLEIKSDHQKTDKEYISNVKEKNSHSDVLLASPCFISPEGKKVGMSNNFYVKLKSKNDVKLLYELAKKNNIEVLGYNEYMPLWFTLACTKKSALPDAMVMSNLFYETGYFECVEPEFIYHDLQNSQDPYFNNQWGLKNTGQHDAAYTGLDLKAEPAWLSSTGTNIKIAIFDDGFEMDHPDLVDNVHGTGFDTFTNTSPSVVRGSHGTACAGIAAAVQNNTLGISGVAPGAQLISISNTQLLSDTPQQIARGFNWARNQNIDIISNSWGGHIPSGIVDDAITDALTLGRNGKGMVIVFSAGNKDSNVLYPANSNPQILVVGAMSPCGERITPNSCNNSYGWSCNGPRLDVMAPGVNIPTTDRQGNNGYDASDYTQTFDGTSSAAPAVAGIAALILSKNPTLTVAQVNNYIEMSAKKVRTDLYNYNNTAGRPNGTWNTQMGYGLVDAEMALLFTPPAPPNSINNESRQKAQETITYDPIIIENNLGISDVDMVKIFPNPNNGVFELKISENLVDYSVSIYSASAREVFSRKNIFKNLIKIDISKELPGIYILNVIDKNGNVYTEKMIKK